MCHPVVWLLNLPLVGNQQAKFFFTDPLFKFLGGPVRRPQRPIPRNPLSVDPHVLLELLSKLEREKARGIDDDSGEDNKGDLHWTNKCVIKAANQSKHFSLRSMQQTCQG